MRTNAHPTILNSQRWYTDKYPIRGNKILAYYRDVHDNADSMRELLWTTQLLRQEYDSPRIGGGIDPSIAWLGSSSIESERDEEGTFTNYLLGVWNDPTGIFDDLDTEEIQDYIVHAEAVALKWLAVYGED